MSWNMMKINLGSEKEETGREYIFISLILSLCLLGDNILIRLFPKSYISQYISPLYFILISICIMFFLPGIHTLGKNKIKSQIIGICIASSVIYIAINFIIGLILKNIALTPYDISPKGIFNNIWTYLPKIIASIMVRDYSVNTFYKKSKYPMFWIIVISFYLSALEFNYVKLTTIRSYEEIFILLVQNIIPIICLSFLMTTICLVGGDLPCIYYICINKVFLFVFPFLPSLPWIAESVINIVYPVMLSLFIWEEYTLLSRLKPVARKENIFSFSAFLLISVAFLWFVIGVFPIYPSVILTGSMEPLIYPGDVVLIEKVSSKEDIYNIKEMDIINFKKEDITITHRVIEIKTDESGNLSFITKGDNNKSEDPWVVPPNDLNGIIRKTLPKVGIPILFIHSNRNIPEGVTDY